MDDFSKAQTAALEVMVPVQAFVRSNVGHTNSVYKVSFISTCE